MFVYRTFWTTPPVVMPKWSLVTPGTALALDLDEVKTFLHRPVEDHFWNDEITRFIRIATLAMEQHLRMTLVSSTWKATLPYFYDNLRIDKRPFTAVTAVEYVAPDTGEITTVSSSIYHALPTTQDCGTLFLAESQEWPETANRWDAVRITATAGYPAGELPDDINHALLMTVAALDAKRGDDRESGGSDTTVYAMKQAKGASVIPPDARNLVSHYKLQQLTVA